MLALLPEALEQAHKTPSWVALLQHNHFPSIDPSISLSALPTWYRNLIIILETHSSAPKIQTCTSLYPTSKQCAKQLIQIDRFSQWKYSVVGSQECHWKIRSPGTTSIDIFQCTNLWAKYFPPTVNMSPVHMVMKILTPRGLGNYSTWHTHTGYDFPGANKHGYRPGYKYVLLLSDLTRQPVYQLVLHTVKPWETTWNPYRTL